MNENVLNGEVNIDNISRTPDISKAIYLITMEIRVTRVMNQGDMIRYLDRKGFKDRNKRAMRIARNSE